MGKLAELVSELARTKHGFAHIVKAGETLLEQADLDMAEQLLKEDRYQGRMLGTYLLGALSAKEKSALRLLKTKVAKDENWRTGNAGKGI